jgi:plasmid stabilization system protein ParE
MPRLIWSLRAKRDMRGIRTYISQDSRSRAAGVIARLHASGTPIYDDYGRLISREIYVYDYRMIYQFRSGAVRILKVRHAARDAFDINVEDEES